MKIPEPTTSLFEVRLHNVDNFLPTLVRVGDFLEFFNVKNEVPRTIGLVRCKKFPEVEMMCLVRQYVFPDAAYNRQNKQQLEGTRWNAYLCHATMKPAV